MENAIEKDDEKMEELLVLQSMTDEEPKYDSVEEKYEDEIMMDQVINMVNEKIFDPLEMNDEREKELLESIFGSMRKMKITSQCK